MDTDLAEGALFTDQYQLTMAQLYFVDGIADRRGQFDYFFRSYPDYGRHKAGYCIFAGLDPFLDWMERATFGPREIDALKGQLTSKGQRRFDSAFLEWLEAQGGFASLRLESIAEGRVVHPNVPVVVVTGPLAMAQLLETTLLNHLNYPTLIATKASRIAEVTGGSALFEFGTRRGPHTGANAGVRAALIGGADHTSNTGVSHALGVDPKGTHAHSMVQAFVSLGLGELEAFRSFARVYPDECTLLVDTIDTLESGVPNAIEVFRELRADGHEPVGIRLDSGDLAYLSIQAAVQLDAAGFEDVAIVLSNDLDEVRIWQILSQIDAEAPRYDVDPGALASRLVYGVGTRLITSQGHGALNGVYKLVAIENESGRALPSMKLSDNPEKRPIPGRKDVWRLYDARGNATADVVATPDERVEGAELRLYHPHRAGVQRSLGPGGVSATERLLETAWDGGRVRSSLSLDELRKRRSRDVARLDPGVRRIIDPHIYHVSLTEQMYRLRDEAARAAAGEVRT